MIGLRHLARRLLDKFLHTRPQPVPAPTPWAGLEPLEQRTLLSAESFMADPILYWNEQALEAALVDSRSDAPDQGGPTLTSRALAIVHVAMFDAYNAVHREFEQIIAKKRRAPRASAEAAVSRAAFKTLKKLYPSQIETFRTALAETREAVPDGRAERRGERVGFKVARRVLKWRRADGSQQMMMHMPTGEPGDHQPDPFNPTQGFLTPMWGDVRPFGLSERYQMRLPAFPALESAEYTAAFEEARVLGALDAEISDRDGDGQPDRTDEQTEIGLFWGYDHRLGTPPRFYNLAARTIAEQMGNTVYENARMFALVNVAMADAGCVSWDMKYAYNIWRPIVAIRNADTDGNPDTIADPDWTPLGAPGNVGDPAGSPGGVGPDADPDPVGGTSSTGDFTPPFPAYTSGHATFGAAAFRTLANFFGTDDIAFDLLSEDTGTVRSFDRLSQAAEENGRSRIYLGIHWSHDDVFGRATGNAIADMVFDRVAEPRAV